MNMKISAVALSIFFAIPAMAAQAQNSSVNKAANKNTLEVIQVSGTRLNDSPIGAVSIMTRDQIAQINPASTVDLLARIPHVDVAQNGNSGGFSYLSIRGGEFNFTLVTIDGIAVNDSTNSRGGGFDFNQINPSAIERIEVYRGGINTIYGGDAISGVINIVTRDSTSPVVTVEAGSNKQLNASVTSSLKLSEQLNVLGAVSVQNKEESSFEDLSSTQLLLKGRYQQDNYEIASLFTHNQTEANGFTEDSGGELFANPRASEQRDSDQTLLGLSATVNINEHVAVSGQVSYLKREEDINNPGIAEGVFSGIPASDITSEYKRVEFDLFSNITVNQNTNLIVGANQRQQDGSNRGFLDFGFPLPVDYDFAQDIRSGYIEAQHEIYDWTLEASARYDAPDDFDNETSIRLGAAFAINQDSSLFAVFNQGYKLPSFFALAHPLVGNSELQPERSDNFELGFNSQISDDISYSVVYFENQFEDLVDFDAELFTNVNRNRVDTSGLEVELSAKLNAYMQLNTNMRYLDIDAEQGVSLRKRANVSGNIRVDTRYKSSLTSVFVDFRDDYLDASIATGNVRLPGYASIGISSTIQIQAQLDLTLNIENALGKRLEDSVGFIQDQAEGRIGLVYSF